MQNWNHCELCGRFSLSRKSVINLHRGRKSMEHQRDDKFEISHRSRYSNQKPVKRKTGDIRNRSPLCSYLNLIGWSHENFKHGKRQNQINKLKIYSTWPVFNKNKLVFAQMKSLESSDCSWIENLLENIHFNARRIRWKVCSSRAVLLTHRNCNINFCEATLLPLPSVFSFNDFFPLNICFTFYCLFNQIIVAPALSCS